MGAILVPLVLFVVIAVVIVVMTRRSAGGETETHEILVDPEVPALRYEVPDGQDPAAVLAALRNSGYVASAEQQAGNQGLLIGLPEGERPDREQVRSVIAGANTNLEGDASPAATPRFDDE